jgi:3-oxoacyl-[acyl-carrier protein] reductase
MSMNTKKLAGKVAVVTGAGRGMGAGIAKRLSEDGATIAITYSNSQTSADKVVRDIEAAGGKAIALRADSTDAIAVKNAMAETVKQLGRIDILVNNAGIAVMGMLDKYSLEDFDRMVAVNIRGVFVASQAAAALMPDGGRIITIGSCNADRMPFQGGSVYAMTKAAIVGLTKGLARDLGPRNITVNNVEPGPTNTDMNPADGPNAEMLKGLMAIKRYADASEIGALVCYLAGPEAGFVTGASILIDGGFDA